ncbi:MAG: proline--tRNA ligase [Candidatus Kapabacteria bacterium]|jgi:prolyl-tRNA synthetase|nr:proline--tRNA ligase [Candidatus Kapabacteria bacterium]
MRQSEYFIPTLKELASETQIPSHQMLLRAGMVRQIGAGIFSFLPLGYKVVKKIMEILREEIDGIGGQEFLLPALNPIEIWEQTNRVEAMGDVMFHIKNRDGLVLAPTHEEIITVHARQHVKSYRDMPQIWYQIQTKFRNEPRPKSGILRGRQFIMKDSYSLDSSFEALDISYDKHFEAYKRIFDRCGLEYFIVGASSGAMGGRQSQEFMVESDAGEDVCAVCDCGYAANTEVATSDVGTVGRAFEGEAMEEFATPNAKTINDLKEQFELPEDRLAKSVVYMIDSKPVLILMRGNDELNEAKLESVFGTNNLRPADTDELPEITGANAGSIGPVNLKTKIQIVADNRLLDAGGMVSGANKDGFHFKNIDFKRDCKIDAYHDLRSVVPGEKCSKCGEPLRVVKAIELGHIFKLGTKYSEALGATFLNSEGKENPIVMGSYGIGVERVLACFIEHNYDDNGIVWNKALSPYHVHLIGLNIQKFENLKEGCEKIYNELSALGFEVLYDDRNESPGVKFNDADLLGLPLQLVVGKKSFENGNVELKNRATGERDIVPVEELVAKVQEYFAD